ncbi:tripartite motif-containing protein 3-like [Branchiostoma floridae]|uniref:Tripartite motif-containing protein 3-like n=1 Tax=Branchiostoma floridae TaxID=7739 RepID=A0A9J7MCH5_BRAFL|nr:tripartite motif-containing protein 3-like [Branchiostoma floridae]
MCERLQQQAKLSKEKRELPLSGHRCNFHPSVSVLGHVTAQSLPSTPTQAERVTFGGYGSGTGQLKYPSGVTVSEDGEIFIADLRNQRIQVFTLQGTSVRQFRTVVSGQDIEPYNVAIDGKGNLWVVGNTETTAFVVQYTKQGEMLRKFDVQKTGWDRGVAVDTRRNHILITQTTGDWPNLRGEVQVFRPDGTLVRTVGQQQGMKRPWYITVDGEENILVSDLCNHCVYVFNEDGQFLFKFGGEGSGKGQLLHPFGICTDRAGNIFVIDRGNSRVEMFDKTGKFVKHIAMGVKEPQAVAMTTQGQVVVTSCRNHTVTVFPNF